MPKSSQGIRAPFNIACPRKDPTTGADGQYSFNPGPGSYTTAVTSLKTSFVPMKDHGVLSALSG